MEKQVRCGRRVEDHLRQRLGWFDANVRLLGSNRKTGACEVQRSEKVLRAGGGEKMERQRLDPDGFQYVRRYLRRD